MKKILWFLVTLSWCLLSASAQMQREGRFNAPGDNVVGKVSAVSKDSVTVVPIKGGDPVVIKAGDNTRIMKDRQPAALDQIKADDTVFARGKLDGNTLQAVMISVLNPEMAQRIQQGGGVVMGFGAGGPGAGRMQFNPDDWGKTFIAGRVKAINETTLTIASPDNQRTLNIDVDENTSFKKGHESITLADVKTDDFVFGPGEVKNNIFVAKELRVGGGRMFMGQPGMMGEPGPAGESNKPDGDKPASTPKN